jgi:hypothetical protein
MQQPNYAETAKQMIKKQTERHMRFWNDRATAKEFCDKTDNILYSLASREDQLNFLLALIEPINNEAEDHAKVCRNPDDCSTSIRHEDVLFFLTQKLERVGFIFSDDKFTSDEKQKMNDALQTILKQVQDLKYGQEVIYENFKEEFDELKNMYYLGKKNWWQQFQGKLASLTAATVIGPQIQGTFQDLISQYTALAGG